MKKKIAKEAKYVSFLGRKMGITYIYDVYSTTSLLLKKINQKNLLTSAFGYNAVIMRQKRLQPHS
jgi:hypothetical protein